MFGKIPAGTFHALLGENGPANRHCVKCPSWASVRPIVASSCWMSGSHGRNPRDAQALGVGMVYQHFTLVPSLTAAENLVVSRADAPAVINWRRSAPRSEPFLAMPFRVPLDRPVGSLAAGEKQKLEILKLLSLEPALHDPRRADFGSDARRSRRISAC